MREQNAPYKPPRKVIKLIVLILVVAGLAYWLIGRMVFLSWADRAYETKDFAGAAKYYNLAVKHWPLNPDNAFKQGLSNYASGNLSQAETNYQKILQSDADNYQVLNNLGNVYRDSGDYVKAEEYYQKALGVNTSARATYDNLSLTYRMQGKTDEEIKILTEGIEKISNKDDKTSLYFSLGYLYRLTDQNDKAGEIYNKILELDPENEQVKESLENLK